MERGAGVFSNVDSPGDASAQAGLHTWYHVLLSSGVSGYIREDNVKELATKTEAGLSKVTVTAQNTNVRPIPLIQSTVEPVAKMNRARRLLFWRKWLNPTITRG